MNFSFWPFLCFGLPGRLLIKREKNWEHSGREGIRKFLLFPNSGHFPLEK